jgi:hypothetical protein
MNGWCSNLRAEWNYGTHGDCHSQRGTGRICLRTLHRRKDLPTELPRGLCGQPHRSHDREIFSWRRDKYLIRILSNRVRVIAHETLNQNWLSRIWSGAWRNLEIPDVGETSSSRNLETRPSPTGVRVAAMDHLRDQVVLTRNPGPVTARAQVAQQLDTPDWMP